MSDSERSRLRASPVTPGEIVAGKYRVERVLGAGGMGVVVAARHLELDQPVALKFILPHALAISGNVERFMREARAAVRLKSDHVARVYDVGRHDRGEEQFPFMVLELLEGTDLAKLREGGMTFAAEDAVEYVLQACEALIEAHALGLVHRDLKPQNLFVTRRLNGTPLVKVLDFGIAKAIGTTTADQMSLTDSSAIIGSPLYMAPEQMRSARTVDPRSDIWALGVVLYELVGGRLPFEGETVTEICIRVVNEQPIPLSQLRPGIDLGLVGTIMRCLEKDPTARFADVAELARALEPFARSGDQAQPRAWRPAGAVITPRPAGSSGSSKALRTGPAARAVIGGSDATGLATPLATGSSNSSLVDSGSSSGEDISGLRTEAAPRLPTVVSAGARFASTDVSWDQGTEPRPASNRGETRSSVWRVLVPVTAVVGIASIGVGLYVGRRSVLPSAPVAAAAPSPPPPPSVPASVLPRAEGPIVDVSALPSAAAPASASAKLPDRRHGAAVPRGRAFASGASGASGGGAAAGAAPTAAAAPNPAVDPNDGRKSEPSTPNGAPILR